MRDLFRNLLSSRARIFFVTLCALLVLDLGRSVYARYGYAQPVERWQPDPRRFAHIAWPPGADLPSNAPRGQTVYMQRCAVCHGPDGRGNGPAAPSLIPRPRDFTLGQYKYKSTATNEVPTDADLTNTVKFGLHASAMPYFGDLLSESDLRQVVEYIKHLSKAFDGAVSRSVAIPPRVAPTAASLARGEHLFQTLGCPGCHGIDGRGGVRLTDAKGDTVVSRDLTAPWTFRGGSDPGALWLRLTTGLAGSPMQSFANVASEAERWDLVNYVLSIARVAPWEAGGKLDGPGHSPDLVRRGAYLVHAQMCQLCHTTIDAAGVYRVDDAYLAGGMRVGFYPHGMGVSRNLTSDAQTGLGERNEQQIVNAFRNGRSVDHVLNMFDMPWAYLHRLTDDDGTAIARYLRSLPAVRNAIPATLRYGVVETLLAKIGRPAPAFPPTTLTFAEQQFGQKTGPSRDWPQSALVIAQWVVLAVGVVAFVAVPRPRRGRWITFGGIAIGILFGMVVYVLYELPLLGAIPPEQIVAGAAGGIPEAKVPESASKEQAALAQRGRYLFTVASCALCHGNDGRGGLKVSWKPMGTLWTRNITPDPETGIGRWSEAEIARAIRSGISRDGYQFHWQGMIWDLASNWDEEDIRALTTYLRVLPPVHNKLSSDRPPADDDCDVYTFWLVANSIAGCH